MLDMLTRLDVGGNAGGHRQEAACIGQGRTMIRERAAEADAETMHEYGYWTFPVACACSALYNGTSYK